MWKLVDGILIQEERTALLKTGTDDAAIEVARDPACCDFADFYDRTDEISQWGPVTEYDDALVRRFVEKVTVLDDGLEVKFKAGISVKVEK